MGQYQKIMVLADNTMQKSPALMRAEGLAARTGATLHLCMVDYSAALSGLRHIDSSVSKMMIDLYMKARLEWLNKQCAELRREGIKAEYSAVWGKPAEQMILSKVFDLHPDVLIKDVKSAPAVALLLHTPLDWQLLRLCPVPVMLVNSSSVHSPQRIIATVDPMESERGPAELNDRVLNAALALAIQCDAELHVVYGFAMDMPTGDHIAGYLPQTEYQKIRQQSRDDHGKAFNKLMDSHSIPTDRRHFLENVNAETAIYEFADQNHTDLVVMGTVYRSGVDRFIFGSTAERTLYRLKCDVLALKPEGFMADVQHWYNATANQGINYNQDSFSTPL